MNYFCIMKHITCILTRAFPLIVFIGIAMACTDHAYDFERTERDVTLLGEDISFPLGQTGPMSIGSLLGEKMADFLIPLEDGTCAIQYKGKAVSFAFDELKNIDGAAPFQRFCDFPISYDFSLFNKPAKPAFNAQGEADLSSLLPGRIEIQSLSRSLDLNVSGLPAQLSSLKSITLTPESRFEITVSIPDCLLTGGTVTPNLSFDMGSFFASDDFPGGIIKINSPLNSGNGYSATTTIPLHKFALDPKNFNPADHSIAVSATLKLSGSCAISQPQTNRNRHAKAPQETKLHVTVIMRDIACKEIEGSFDYSRKSQVTFQLGDLAAGLTDKLSGDIHFDFVDPTILLDIESNITIPVSAKLTLAARQKKVKYAEVKNIPVVFPVANPGASVSKRIRIAKNPAHNPGEESIALDLTNLLAKIPDDILITANASTQSNQTSVLRIGENYRISISPQIIIPLNLGPDTKVAFRDTLALPTQLGELIDKNEFQVMGEIDNGFPLQFTFSLVMVDKDGVPLSETVRQVLAADSTSELALTLARLPGADPTQAASAVLIFEADGVSDSRPIRTEDAIEAKLHAVIPGGYHLAL